MAAVFERRLWDTQEDELRTVSPSMPSVRMAVVKLDFTTAVITMSACGRGPDGMHDCRLDWNIERLAESHEHRERTIDASTLWTVTQDDYKPQRGRDECCERLAQQQPFS